MKKMQKTVKELNNEVTKLRAELLLTENRLTRARFKLLKPNHWYRIQNYSDMPPIFLYITKCRIVRDKIKMRDKIKITGWEVKHRTIANVNGALVQGAEGIERISNQRVVQIQILDGEVFVDRDLRGIEPISRLEFLLQVGLGEHQIFCIRKTKSGEDVHVTLDGRTILGVIVPCEALYME